MLSIKIILCLFFSVFIFFGILNSATLKNIFFSLLTGLFSLFGIAISVYILFTNGLNLDYKFMNAFEKSQTDYEINFSYLLLALSLTFILISISKLMYWKLKQTYSLIK